MTVVPHDRSRTLNRRQALVTGPMTICCSGPSARFPEMVFAR
ncbi:hypothetical protein ACFVZR_11970 [Streptomyces sp. NPDC058316]